MQLVLQPSNLSTQHNVTTVAFLCNDLINRFCVVFALNLGAKELNTVRLVCKSFATALTIDKTYLFKRDVTANDLRRQELCTDNYVPQVVAEVVTAFLSLGIHNHAKSIVEANIDPNSNATHPIWVKHSVTHILMDQNMYLLGQILGRGSKAVRSYGATLTVQELTTLLDYATQLVEFQQAYLTQNGKVNLSLLNTISPQLVCTFCQQHNISEEEVRSYISIVDVISKQFKVEIKLRNLEIKTAYQRSLFTDIYNWVNKDDLGVLLFTMVMCLVLALIVKH